MPVPAHYKETSASVHNKPTLLADITSKAPWWTLYQDPILNQLEAKVTCGNENLKVALNRYQEARAILEATRSALYPTVLGIGNAARQKNSVLVNNNSQGSKLLYNTFILSSTLNYEVDAWGQIRNAVKTSDNLAKASQNDLIAISLSMHTLLAHNYFQLRGADTAISILDQSVHAYQKALYLTQQLHNGGAVDQFEVDEAIMVLAQAKTLAQDMRLTRSKLENTIAVLTGQIAANFHIPPRRTHLKVVNISPDLPPTLVERRPDIIAAERRVAAANAQIGVAKAAFFPQFNLSGLIGFQSGQLPKLFSAKSLSWSLGPPSSLIIAQPEITQILFDGFYLQAQLARANAQYQETIHLYQQTILTAFQEVEDALISIHALDKEAQTQTQAYLAAKRAWQKSNQRYQGGIATFLDVVIPETQALRAELNLIDIKTRRQVASVSLIKALGGGWRSPA